MNITDFPVPVANILSTLTTESSTLAVWFIGSRANGTERKDSDWDFLVFIDGEISEKNVRCAYVDLVNVDKYFQYLLEGQKLDLSGSFIKNWNWREISSELAHYSESNKA